MIDLPPCLIEARQRGEAKANAGDPIWERNENGRLRRRPSFVVARRMVWQSMRDEGFSYPDIARATGCRHHSTVFTCVNRKTTP